MTVKRRQVAITVLATSALAWGFAACGDDDEESSAAPQAVESAQPKTSPDPGEPAGGKDGDAQSRSESEEDDEDGGASAATSRPGAAQGDALRSVTSSNEFAEGLRRWRELREQLNDGSPEGDERAAEEMEELERRFREALAEARQAQGVPGHDAPSYEFGEGPGLNDD